DLNAREKLILVVAVLVIIGMGVYPQPFLRRMDRSVTAVVRRLELKAPNVAAKLPARQVERTR
ncbi:MAG: Fe-S-binding domain-containing protein, partial [Acidobacteriia bacterium]|nr:Fe-S-binding domain-containing protein [Terriglobia bacterium]